MPDPAHPTRLFPNGTVSGRHEGRGFTYYNGRLGGAPRAAVRFHSAFTVLCDWVPKSRIRVLESAVEAAPVDGNIDLAGVRVADRVVLFPTEPGQLRSAVSFFFPDAPPAKLRILLTGLAPGLWDVWLDGFLEYPDLPSEPPAGILQFEGPPGNYFLRRR